MRNIDSFQNPVFIPKNSFQASEAQALNLKDSTVLLVEDNDMHEPLFWRYGATYLNSYIT